MAAVTEFKSERAYEFWLQQMGDQVRILDVSTTKRWSILTGFLGDTKTYTVTYEQTSRASPQSVVRPQPALTPAHGYCNSCGSVLRLGSRFCSSCGATVEPRSVGNGTVGSATERVAAEADCAACKFPNPHDASVCINCGKVMVGISNPPGTVTPRAEGKTNRWVWVCIAAVVVVVICIISLAPRTPTPKSEPELKEAESRQAAQQAEDAFKNMTPAQHFSTAKSDLHAGAPNDEVAEGMKHLDALIGTPMEGQAKALRARYQAEKAKADKAEAAVAAQVARQEKENAQAQKAATKALREEWIRNAQQELWRQGVEMTCQARGTTLYVKYVLAGEAFAFQFGETFLGKNGATLKALGFRKSICRTVKTGGRGIWHNISAATRPIRPSPLDISPPFD